MKKTLVTAFALLTLLATGCIGKNNSFCLFKGLVEWNRTWHEEKWVNEAVYIGLHILPAYEILFLGDALIFNSIDFWTGDNPMKGAFASVDAPARDYCIVSNGDGTATLTCKGQTCTLIRVEDGFAMSRNGRTLGTVTREGSLVTFTGADGSVQTVLR